MNQGSDTQIPGIFIKYIDPSGAAYLDKRLHVGDQLLRINNVDLVHATHDTAQGLLGGNAKPEAASDDDRLTLLVYRGYFLNRKNDNCDTTHQHNHNHHHHHQQHHQHRTFPSELSELLKNSNENNCWNIINIDLNKKFGKGLGFSIIGRLDGLGVYVSHIVSSPLFVLVANIIFVFRMPLMCIHV